MAEEDFQEDNYYAVKAGYTLATIKNAKPHTKKKKKRFKYYIWNLHFSNFPNHSMDWACSL